MNILQEEDIIKGLPDQALFQEATNPTGQLKQFLVVSEIQRRKEMRKDFEAQQQQDQGTVKDQIIMEAMGIPSVMPPQMASAPKPMGQAGAPPMGAMPPPMGGMPPQGAPPMAPPMPQGMPPMPQGGIASAPQAMPPMRMAQGGIVQMADLGQVPFLDQYVPESYFGPVQGGPTVRDQIDRLIESGMSAADLLAFATKKFRANPEAVQYVVDKIGGSGAMADAVSGMTEMDATRLSQATPQPELDYTFPQEGPREVRASAQRGMEMMLEELDQNDMQRRIEALGVNEALGIGPVGPVSNPFGTKSGIASIGGGDARVQAVGSAEVQSQPARLARDPFSDPSVVAGLEQNRQQAGDFLSGLNQRIAERQAAGGNRDMRFMNIPEEATIGGKGEPTVVTEAVTALSETPGPQDRSNKIVDIAQSNRELGIGPRGPVSNPFGTKKVADALAELEEVTVDRERKDLSGILANLTKGEKDTPMPALDFSDLIADSKQQALANAMIQLGAGVASGDVAKGLSAAGTAAMKGTADARALDMKRRLAEYQAGREDIRRGEETRRYEEGMKLKREQFDSDVAYRAAKLSADIEAASGLNRRALLTNVSAMIQETNDEILRLQSLGSGPEDPAMMELQSYLNVLKTQSQKYANEIAASLAKADEFDGFEVVGTR